MADTKSTLANSMMNLDALIASREGGPLVELPIDQDELLHRYEQLYTGAISDVLREFQLLDQALPNTIGSLREYRSVAGIAFTVKSSPSSRIRGEMEVRTKMLDELVPGSFVVWDTSGDEKATLWGGVMTAAAKARGVRGACIDGGIRDTHQILDAEFPVFYRHRNPNGSLGRCLITDYQGPIRIGDVDVRPGDIIVGDIDGVVCVPRKIAVEVLERAERVLSNEDTIFGWVAEGRSASEISSQGGYF
ncbi:MAG: RraA family protein [Planctomycetota bacterium]